MNSYDIKADVVMSSSGVNDRNRLPPSDVLCLASYLLIGHCRFWTTRNGCNVATKISTLFRYIFARSRYLF